MTRHALQTGSTGGGLRVVRAATADALAVDLAAAFAGSAAPGPLDRCVVAVQGPGLGRWLRGEMARRLGAWGGVETPFLRGFLLDLACQGTGHRPPRGREDLDHLAFRIAAVLAQASRGQAPLPDHAAGPVLAMVRSEEGALDHAALLRLARRLADAFDRYQVDRPELIQAWQQGRSGLPAEAAAALVELEAWQRPLWQVTARESISHGAWEQLRSLVVAMERGQVPPTARLPAFVSVFGVSLLSPFLVRVLQAMARHTRVTLHMLTPTQAFVAERSTRRQLLWRAAESGTSASDLAEALHMQAGHPLLDAMGQQASQAERVLLDLDADLQDTAGEPRVAASMLERLQRDMLLDQPPELGSAQPDGSVQVHSVTTPLRAAEVAHDAVLAAMSDMPGLRPERVAILTPDIRGVGRFLESVFEQRGVIPLTASDRQLARSSSLAEAMHHAMAAVTDGLTMAGVRATLGQAGVLERLRLGADGLVRWLDRLEQAGARRFLDPRDRAARLERPQTPDDRIHTLQWAVDRVVLGLAMASASDPLALVASPAASVDPELLPSPASGSAGLEELHQVVQAIEAVADFLRAATEAQPLSQWCARLLELAERLLPPADHPAFGLERRQLDQGLERLAQAAVQGGFLEPLDFGMAREQLTHAMADAREGTHFASGGVTLARLSPMRSVPFDVLVLVGLDLGAFPRGRHADGLDLIASAPRAGDQLPRHEDLQLFLECLHAARRRLVVIHQGVDPRGGDRRPPSPVVDQLLDACAASSADSERLRASLITVHPARADQPEAWTGQAGFDAPAHRCALAAEQGRRAPDTWDFMRGAVIEPRLPDATQAWTRALRDPAEALLERLGLRMPDTAALVAEGDELIVTDALEKWRLRESCMRAILRGREPLAWEREVRLHGWLPHGQVGGDLARATLEPVQDAVEAVAKAAVSEGWITAGPARTQAVDHTIELRGQAFSVQVEQLEGASVQVLWHPAGSDHHRVALWMRHLMWSLISPGSHSITASIGRKNAKVHGPVDPVAARRRLERMLDLAGAATCVPLPIDPKLLMASDPQATPEERMEKVLLVLHGRPGKDAPPGLLQDPANALVFAGERWGPGGRVNVGSASVPTGLDDLAAEIRQAMKEDGWLA